MHDPSTYVSRPAHSMHGQPLVPVLKAWEGWEIAKSSEVERRNLIGNLSISFYGWAGTGWGKNTGERRRKDGVGYWVSWGSG